MVRNFILTGLALVGASSQALSQSTGDDPFSRIPWENGPSNALLGKEAAITVPSGCLFSGGEGTRQFLELTENPPSGDERGVIYCLATTTAGEEYEWFAVFEFRADGYVSDDDRDELKPEPILKSIREGTEAANKERRSRGWEELRVIGWQREPFYAPESNNLTWSIIGETSSGRSVNHAVRLLGRRGVMSVDLVVGPENYPAAVQEFDNVIASFNFLPGETYAEWRAGDPLATYGLTALVAGGTGAILAKTGLLQKFGKVIAIGVLTLLVSLKNFFAGIWRSITGKAESPDPER
jgi:uncharacterized membrane-anchored protein